MFGLAVLVALGIYVYLAKVAVKHIGKYTEQARKVRNHCGLCADSDVGHHSGATLSPAYL